MTAEWDVVVDSSVELLAKPDQALFALAEKRAGVQHSDILFIDNSRGYVRAASAFGWQTFLYDSSDHVAACRDLAGFLQECE